MYNYDYMNKYLYNNDNSNFDNSYINSELENTNYRNLLFNNNEFITDADPNISESINTGGNNNLFTPEQGFTLGNEFKNIYQPYRNYKPQILRANSDKSAMYLKLASTWFAMHELNLYLDNFPNDKSMLKLFNDYRKNYNTLLKQYESMYGPITINSDAQNNINEFLWEEQIWPWEDRNV